MQNEIMLVLTGGPTWKQTHFNVSELYSEIDLVIESPKSAARIVTELTHVSILEGWINFKTDLLLIDSHPVSNKIYKIYTQAAEIDGDGEKRTSFWFYITFDNHKHPKTFSVSPFKIHKVEKQKKKIV